MKKATLYLAMTCALLIGCHESPESQPEPEPKPEPQQQVYKFDPSVVKHPEVNIGCASITPVERIEPIEYGEVIYIKLEKSQGKGCNNTSDITLGSATSTDSFVMNYTGGITININFNIGFLEGGHADYNKKNLKTLYLELTKNQHFYKRHDLDKNKAKQTVSLSDMPMEKGDYVDLQIRFETRTARSIYIARGRGVTGSVSFERTDPAQ